MRALSARVLFAVLVVAVLVVADAALPAHASTPPPSYVALGDSYAAGPLIPVQIPSAGSCGRSDHNYAHLVASALAYAAFRDVSCSGAETGDMYDPQSGIYPSAPPPQLDALDANTRVVTLQIGGNDIGFTSIIENCASPVPSGHPCRDHYVVNGDDQLADAIAATAPKVAAVIQAIHARAPRARVDVLGYPSILPDDGSSCWPQMPIAPDDVPYLVATEKRLDGMIRTQAKANSARYVDLYTPSIGHDACQLVTVRWVEPVVPVLPAFPVHPNSNGMAAFAQIVLQRIG